MKDFKLIYTCITIILLAGTSCKKSAFLNTLPDQSQVVPQSLSDFQALLDNDNAMNGTGSGLVPALGVIGSDNYYALEKYYMVYLTKNDRNEYTWQSNPYPGESLKDWNYAYLSVLYCNIVLDGLNSPGLNKNPREEYNNLMGSALFYRAHIFYQLAQVFAQPYDSTTAQKDLGIPLRISANVFQQNKRASVEQTYNKIIKDLKKSCRLLPVRPLIKTRPSRPAAYALLARVYQTMGKYVMAYHYADSCLLLYHSLMDFNKLDSTSPNPVPRFNDEVIFGCNISNTHSVISPGFIRIDSTLYGSYTINDLRRVIFFRQSSGLPRYKGSYYGFNLFLFGGIATDEVYLIRAECYARLGMTSAAMSDLNTLLKTRWRSNFFIPYTAVDAEDALRQILVERRKELVMRGLRWTDLRRLNSDPRFKKTLKRIIMGKTYSLPPGDPRYTWPIPDDVLSFNPDMKQNPR